VPLPSLRSLLEVGAHVGHKKQHSHPATRRFIYTVKDGVFVINVEKTIEYLKQAIDFLKRTLKEGGVVLFVGTKPQAREALKKTAQSVGQPYVSTRWLGGTLTNFETVKKSLFQLQELDKKMNDPAFETLRKRERTHLKEKHTKLTQIFEGILRLTKPPDVLFVVDAYYEDIAVSEANRLGIPVVALMDTNADPEAITYPIPVNDESKRAVEMILEVISEQLSGVKIGEKAAEEKKREQPVTRKVQPKPAARKISKVVKPTKKVSRKTKSVAKPKSTKKAKKKK